MPIEIVFALIAFTFGGSTFLGFWAGRARRREDRLALQSRAWWNGVSDQWKHRPVGNRLPDTENPYRRELERTRRA